jgi:hypothetical protein
MTVCWTVACDETQTSSYFLISQTSPLSHSFVFALFTTTSTHFFSPFSGVSGRFSPPAASTVDIRLNSPPTGASADPSQPGNCAC